MPASGFKSRGIEAGNRIAIYMGNRPEMVLLALAINKLGAIWVPVNTDYKGEWLLDTLLRSRCKMLVTDEPLQSRLAEVQGRLDGVQLLLLGDIASSPLDNPHSYDELLPASHSGQITVVWITVIPVQFCGLPAQPVNPRV